MRKFVHLFGIIVFAGLFSIPVSADSDKSKKIEDLYIWKVSDELKLTTKQEQELSKIIRSLNEEKSSLNEKLQKNLVSMKEKKDKELKKILSDYKKNLKSLSLLNLKEFESIEKQFGSEKAAQYVQIKQTLADQIRAALSQGK